MDNLPELDEDDYSIILEEAYVMYRLSNRGAKGQLITVQDSLDYWVMLATRNWLQEKIDEE